MKHAHAKTRDFNKLKNRLKNLLPAERFKHSLRAVEIAKRLALHWGADKEAARIAALLHDCSRFLDRDGMLKKALGLRFKIDRIQRFEPKLLHAELSAYFAKEKFGITDKKILSAIRSHTVGNSNMSLLDKIVYLADHIEEDRDYPGHKRVKSLAFKNIDQAIIFSLESMIKRLIKLGFPLYRKTVETRNNLILKKINERQ